MKHAKNKLSDIIRLSYKRARAIHVSRRAWILIASAVALCVSALFAYRLTHPQPPLQVIQNDDLPPAVQVAMVNGRPQLVDSNHEGRVVQLRGVNRMGAEWGCVVNTFSDPPMKGVFLDSHVNSDDPNYDAPLMRQWGVNVVRVPLNEDCWMGNSVHTQTDPTPSEYIGEPYRAAVEKYVAGLLKHGMAVVLDLHLSRGFPSTCPSDAQSTGQTIDPDRSVCLKPMPTASAIDFWKSVASVSNDQVAFKNNKSVIFDLFNEPEPRSLFPLRDQGPPVSPSPTIAEVWSCLIHGGGACPNDHSAVGLQDLLDAVRSVGAQNLVLAEGDATGGNLYGWINPHEPKPLTDPLHNLAASFHSYGQVFPNNGVESVAEYDPVAQDQASPDQPYPLPCGVLACMSKTVEAISAQVPVVVGEFGQSDCKADAVSKLMTDLDDRFKDGQSISYLAWTWNVSPHSSGKPGGAAEGFVQCKGSDLSKLSYYLLAQWNGTPTRSCETFSSSATGTCADGGYGFGYGEAVKCHLQHAAGIVPARGDGECTPGVGNDRGR